MKYLRYKGEFFSVQGTLWRVELWQESDKEYDVVGDLTFDADEPLVLEWDTKPKEKVICGSTATLKIISPGDRTYEDLYSVEVGRVRLDVYRNDSLYWSGCIDTEFYEEPYEQFKGYTVTLGFSDFGVLDRIKYNLIGMQSLYDLVNDGLSRCGIKYERINETLISTQLSPTSGQMSLADIKVRSDNFYDEDGEASTIYDVLEGILQPLALRLIQREGTIYVYDLHGLYTKGDTQEINWVGDSQTMSVDVVYNNAKITWSPYIYSENLLPTNCWDDKITTPTELSCLNDIDGVQVDLSNIPGYQYKSVNYYTIHQTTQKTQDDNSITLSKGDEGFTIWLSGIGRNAVLGADGRNKFYKIVPQMGGNNSEGIAAVFKSFAFRLERGELIHNAEYITYSPLYLFGRSIPGAYLFKTKEIWIPPVGNLGDTRDAGEGYITAYPQQSLLLRVSMNMLLDPRFNPFEDAYDLSTDLSSDLIFKGWQDFWGKYGNFVYVPVAIKFQPDGSDIVYVWDNRSETATATLGGGNRVLGHDRLFHTYGKWLKFSTTDDRYDHYGYLAYYDSNDRIGSSGVGGWNRNRPAIDSHNQPLRQDLKTAEDGQYIPYPNFGEKGGRLWIEVLNHRWIVDSLDQEGKKRGDDRIEAINWILLELPEVAVVKNMYNGLSLDDEDIEYDAELNPAAKEPIELNTICGTYQNGLPLARGAYFNVDNNQISEFTRAGRTSQVEDLLIGTLYSQYAKRRTVLTGDSQLLNGPIVAYTELNQPNKLFMMSGDVQDIRADYSDATFVEFRPDEYKRVTE